MPFRIFGISFLILCHFFQSICKEAYSQEKVLEIGEELKFEVSYGFIKLGYIKMILTGTRKEGKKIIKNAKFEVKTYPEVPFIKLNDILESEMEYFENEIYSKKYYETNFKDKSITRTDYKFNYSKDYVDTNIETDGKTDKKEKISIKDKLKLRDEVCWLYEARMNSFINKNFNIPVFVKEEESSVRYSFNVNSTVINIEKFNYDISAIKLEGTSDFTGLFGFKGEFLILLSDDEFRVPLKAYFSSSLGNVVWELISYKKQKWSPPAFRK
ncbi:MAG: hypothetical protein HGGPFJEG_02934 [Ignavibacteria bacterium]|nr:hypothetical protein [Ignavibacteria bacterium]